MWEKLEFCLFLVALGVGGHCNGHLMEELGQMSLLPVIDTVVFVREGRNGIHPRDFSGREEWAQCGRHPRQTEFLCPVISP